MPFAPELAESFRCAGRTVYVVASGAYRDTGRLRVSVLWSSRPQRLTGADMAVFESGKAAAVARLRTRLATLVVST